jgi:PemK-like, MazF-like toxin of type II toxin-antitoxin system/Ribbon-helix-helix protein, copG family
MTARKFAISLPEELFERLERDRQERGMNRSEYVANAVADHLHRRREHELEEQHVRGYLEHPETETVVPVTARMRGIPVEVPLDPGDGVPRPCVANADNVTTVTKSRLVRRIGRLPPEKLRAVEDALRFALAL